MQYRLASTEDGPTLAVLNAQLIQDEGHRNSMTVAQLEDRMWGWLTQAHIQALLWRGSPRGRGVRLVSANCGRRVSPAMLSSFVIADVRALVAKRLPPGDCVPPGCGARHNAPTVSVVGAECPAVAFWRAVGYTDYDLTLAIMPRP